MSQQTPEIPIGERVRFYREGQHKTQVVVAGLAGVSEDYLSQIERGLKTPTIALLHKIARILNVSTAALLGEPASEIGSPSHPAVSALHSALLSYGRPGKDAAPNLTDLRVSVDAAWTAWQSSPTRYTDVGRLLPDLVMDVEQALRADLGGGEAAGRREAAAIAADLYFLLRTVCKRLGRVDLSLLAADRGVRASEQTEDPLRLASAKWNLGHVFLAENQPNAAEEVAIKAAEALEPHVAEASSATVSMYGALWLVAAVAAVRNGDAWTARDRIREKAWPAARSTGEGNVMWTVFGPTNVALHAVSVEMEVGESAEALRLADDIDVGRSPSMERRLTFMLEVARCYEQRREDPAVLVHLLDAEREGPEDMRYNVLSRDLVRGLLKRARPSYAAQVRGLAKRIELLPA